MNNLIITIGIPLLWTSFLLLTEFPKWLNFKPFNCITCLSFWSVLILLTYSNGIDINTIGYAGIAAYISLVAKRILFRI